MDDGKIVLIGNESDVLHCGYSHAIKEGGKRYPSAVHYTHSMILSQLGVDENVILELLSTSSTDVPAKAHHLLTQNMPAGHDLNTLAEYLQKSKQSYTMAGLRLRVEQDKEFEKTLMDTKETLLVVCDKKDRELGIGMEENQFIEWMNRERANYEALSFWMQNEAAKPAALGANQLGFLLMWMRYEVRQQRKQAMLVKQPDVVDGLSTDNDDKPVKVKASDLIISLQGIFRPLSNYYPLHFDMKGERYRSVEHYAYEKLFDALKLDDKQIEKIQTTINPCDVPVVAERVFKKLDLKPEAIESKWSKMDRWRQSAMKHKIHQIDYLQQLLLSTGDAIIIDCAQGDPLWTCSSSEAELQHLLTKKYVTPATIINWMIDKSNNNGRVVSHLKGNKTGLLLMELRDKLAANTKDRIPLVSPLTSSLSTISHNIICFTAEGVWHPLYPAEIRAAPDQPLLPSPAHYVAQQAVKCLAFNKQDAEYVLEPRSSLACWERLHELIESRSHELEREQSWWMEKRQKAIKDALQLLLEQHPPVLRALLDTGDAMLVYCSRFCSIETELSIGMRETDLRFWLHTVDISTTELLEMCSRPMAFRPSYLGGNRLGMILMQLRREFILRGVFPHTLPELPITTETILGTDSPTENMMVSEKFDVLNPNNYYSSFVNPLFILAKVKDDAVLLNAARRTKAPPRLISTNEEKISEVVKYVEARGDRERSKELNMEDSPLVEADSELLRSVFIRLCGNLQSMMTELDKQQSEMLLYSSEVNRLRDIRQTLEKTRDNSFDRPPREREPQLTGYVPPVVHDRENRSPMTAPSHRRMDRDYKIPRRNRSPDRDRRREGHVRNFLDSHNDRRRDRDRERDREPRVVSPIRKREKVATPPPEPVKPKVPKVRPPAEELSDGEIVSSDED